MYLEWEVEVAGFFTAHVLGSTNSEKVIWIL